MWTWGRAKCGCLGNGSEEAHCAVPTVVEALKDVKIENISCGIRHTAAWTGMLLKPINTIDVIPHASLYVKAAQMINC